MKFSFVIPAYNNYKLLHQLLHDIYRNCSRPHEIIVTDDGDDNETVNGLEWWRTTSLLPIIHLQHENVGFLRNSNYGLKKADGDVVCLVSTDVRIYENLVTYWNNQDAVVGGRYLDFDTGWNSFGNGVIFPYLEGWLLCATKENWKLLDYFDGRFAPNDMEDIDFSTKALRAGLLLTTYPEGYVSHIGAQSIRYGPEREKITLENKKKFYEKWVA